MKEQDEPSSLSFSDSILMQREQRRLTPSITIITFPRAFAKKNYINQVRDVTRITQSVQICVRRYYCAFSIKKKGGKNKHVFVTVNEKQAGAIIANFGIKYPIPISIDLNWNLMSYFCTFFF